MGVKIVVLAILAGIAAHQSVAVNTAHVIVPAASYAGVPLTRDVGIEAKVNTGNAGRKDN